MIGRLAMEHGPFEDVFQISANEDFLLVYLCAREGIVCLRLKHFFNLVFIVCNFAFGPPQFCSSVFLHTFLCVS